MQWFFLVLALMAALAELNTGTFYLAGVAAAALVTAVLGRWVPDDWLIVLFVLLSAGLMASVNLYRRKSTRKASLPDFDVGQSVSVVSVNRPGGHVTVFYRGANWEAVMDGDAVVSPGDTAIIAGRTDKLLRLVLPRQRAQT